MDRFHNAEVLAICLWVASLRLTIAAFGNQSGCASLSSVCSVDLFRLERRDSFANHFESAASSSHVSGIVNDLACPVRWIHIERKHMPPLSTNKNFCSFGVLDSVTRIVVLIKSASRRLLANVPRMPAECQQSAECKYIYKLPRRGVLLKRYWPGWRFEFPWPGVYHSRHLTGRLQREPRGVISPEKLTPPRGSILGGVGTLGAEPRCGVCQ
jgi:hypothetical protein